MLETLLKDKKVKLLNIVRNNYKELMNSKIETSCEFILKKDEVAMIITELLVYKTIQLLSSPGLENKEVIVILGK
jgi:hypothetical protein